MKLQRVNFFQFYRHVMEFYQYSRFLAGSRFLDFRFRAPDRVEIAMNIDIGATG